MLVMPTHLFMKDLVRFPLHSVKLPQFSPCFSSYILRPLRLTDSQVSTTFLAKFVPGRLEGSPLQSTEQ